VDDSAESLVISQECRRILGDPHYSEQTCVRLVRWLEHPNAAVSDLAGQCLLQLGSRAFDDLLAIVNASQPWPRAVWVLSGLSIQSDRLLPFLRVWLSTASDDLESQCAVSMAQILVARKQAGHAPDRSDVESCMRSMSRFASVSPAMRLHLQEFREGLASV
jgi:hypothetical protein